MTGRPIPLAPVPRSEDISTIEQQSARHQGNNAFEVTRDPLLGSPIHSTRQKRA
jgi:hypothetical protein